MYPCSPGLAKPIQRITRYQIASKCLVGLMMFDGHGRRLDAAWSWHRWLCGGGWGKATACYAIGSSCGRNHAADTASAKGFDEGKIAVAGRTLWTKWFLNAARTEAMAGMAGSTGLASRGWTLQWSLHQTEYNSRGTQIVHWIAKHHCADEGSIEVQSY